ncbi:MAG: His Kinase (phospho-acceptor) protein [bacterium]|nr:His Kinase (phospho-acceptor) protein [bacterium]
MACILVVDDNALNRELLRAYLEAEGHQLREAASGDEALRIAAAHPPDLVLLDIMMPGMNGFEVGATLKQRAQPEFLPIVLVSALTDPSSRALGLKRSADDFLSKPVERTELMARVKNLLMLRRHAHELAQRNRDLVETQRFRDEMAELIVHDLKNPLAVVMANLDFVLADPIEDGHREALDDARRGGQRALRLLANLLDLTKLEGGRMVLRQNALPLQALVAPLVESRTRFLAHRGIALEATLGDDRVFVDDELIRRVVENILDNAARYTPAGGRIALFTVAGASAASVELCIGNSGVAIPEAAHARIFDKFGQAEGAQRTNLGLGLYFCRLVAEAHGGRIRIESHVDLPTVFRISLPRAQ